MTIMKDLKLGESWKVCNEAFIRLSCNLLEWGTGCNEVGGGGFY